MSIRKALLALTVSLCFNGSLLADTLALKPDHPARYVVVKGDTVVQYGKVMEVLDLLGQVGITQMGLVTQPAAK